MSSSAGTSNTNGAQQQPEFQDCTPCRLMGALPPEQSHARSRVLSSQHIRQRNIHRSWSLLHDCQRRTGAAASKRSAGSRFCTIPWEDPRCHGRRLHRSRAVPSSDVTASCALFSESQAILLENVHSLNLHAHSPVTRPCAPPPAVRAVGAWIDMAATVDHLQSVKGCG